MNCVDDGNYILITHDRDHAGLVPLGLESLSPSTLYLNSMIFLWPLLSPWMLTHLKLLVLTIPASHLLLPGKNGQSSHRLQGPGSDSKGQGHSGGWAARPNDLRAPLQFLRTGPDRSVPEPGGLYAQSQPWRWAFHSNCCPYSSLMHACHFTSSHSVLSLNPALISFFFLFLEVHVAPLHLTPALSWGETDGLMASQCAPRPTAPSTSP